MASKVVDKDIVSPMVQDFNNDEHFVSNFIIKFIEMFEYVLP